MLDVAIEWQGKTLPGLRVGWAMAHPAHPAVPALLLNMRGCYNRQNLHSLFNVAACAMYVIFYLAYM